MDVRIDIENKFDKDLKKLSRVEQTAISKEIKQLINAFKEEKKTSPLLFKIKKFIIGDSLDSSLYVLRINKDLRIILTSEEDPLFNLHILTFLRIVRRNELDKTYSGLIKSFKQSFIFKGGK